MHGIVIIIIGIVQKQLSRRKASKRHKKQILFKTMQELHKRKMDKVFLFIVWICSMILNINKFTVDHSRSLGGFQLNILPNNRPTWFKLLDSQITHLKTSQIRLVVNSHSNCAHFLVFAKDKFWEMCKIWFQLLLIPEFQFQPSQVSDSFYYFISMEIVCFEFHGQ